MEAQAAEVQDLFKLMTKSLSTPEPVKVLKPLTDVHAAMGRCAKFETELQINVPGIETNW